MFLRQYTRKKAGKVHRYWALVESMRTEEGPRQRVVAHLGELNHSRHRRWQRTIVFYNRHGDAEQLRLFPDDPSLSLPDDPDIVRVRLSSAGGTNARAFGDVWLGVWLWRLLKLDEIVDRHLPAGRHTVCPADVVAIEVIHRLCAPSSEFALAEHWYASTGLEDLLGIPDHEITKTARQGRGTGGPTQGAFPSGGEGGENHDCQVWQTPGDVEMEDGGGCGRRSTTWRSRLA